MEEMKNIETERKNGNWKWLTLAIVVVLIGGLTFILGAQYIGSDGMKIDLPDLPVGTTIRTTTQENTQQMMITGGNIMDETVTSGKTITLGSGRYTMAFSSDNNVKVGLQKKPNGIFVCCNNDEPLKTGSYVFAVNTGMEGEFELTIKGSNPTAHVMISQQWTY